MRFHTSLPVKNVPETVAFYSALFGVAPTKQRPDYAKFLPQTPDINLTFHEASDASALLTDLHLGFELSDQQSLDDAYSRMQAAGWISEERKSSVCCYANQDKFWITDPNGYRWEIYRVLSDTEHKVDAASTCCAPSTETSAGCC